MHTTMNRQQSEAIAYNICNKLPTETREKLFDQDLVTDFVQHIVAEELESWQYCYIESDEYNNPLTPAYVAESFTASTLESLAEEFISENDPFTMATTPTQRDARMVAAAGSDESYCETQLNLYQSSCIQTFVPVLSDALDGAVDLTESEQESIAQHLVEAVDIWKWYLLTTEAREVSEEPAKTVGEWVLYSCQSEIPYFIELVCDKSVDQNTLAENMSDFAVPKALTIDLIQYAEKAGLED